MRVFPVLSFLVFFLLSCTQAPQSGSRGFPQLPVGAYLGSLQWGEDSVVEPFYLLVEKAGHRIVLASSNGAMKEKEARYEGRRLRFQADPGLYLELDATEEEVQDVQNKPVFWSGKVEREVKGRDDGNGHLRSGPGRWRLLALSSIASGAERDELRSYAVQYKKDEGSAQRFETYSDLKPLLERRLKILSSRSAHLEEQLRNLDAQLSKVSEQLDVAQSGSVLGKTISLEQSISQREGLWLEQRMHSHTPELFAYSSEDIAYAQEILQLQKTVEREQNMLNPPVLNQGQSYFEDPQL